MRVLVTLLMLVVALPRGSNARALSPGPLWLPLILREPCTGHRASLTLSASAASLTVGDTLTVTATLTNTGCVGLGLPLYRLLVTPGGEEAVLGPLSPSSEVHYYAVSPGTHDRAQFVLDAIASGEAALSATVSYEVHLGYPGPAYWGASSSTVITVSVLPRVATAEAIL